MSVHQAPSFACIDLHRIAALEMGAYAVVQVCTTSAVIQELDTVLGFRSWVCTASSYQLMMFSERDVSVSNHHMQQAPLIKPLSYAAM